MSKLVVALFNKLLNGAKDSLGYSVYDDDAILPKDAEDLKNVVVVYREGAAPVMPVANNRNRTHSFSLDFHVPVDLIDVFKSNVTEVTELANLNIFSILGNKVLVMMESEAVSGSPASYDSIFQSYTISGQVRATDVLDMCAGFKMVIDDEECNLYTSYLLGRTWQVAQDTELSQLDPSGIVLEPVITQTSSVTELKFSFAYVDTSSFCDKCLSAFVGKSVAPIFNVRLPLTDKHSMVGEFVLTSISQSFDKADWLTFDVILSRTV